VIASIGALEDELNREFKELSGCMAKRPRKTQAQCWKAVRPAFVLS
jgi:hypothetical protein